MQSDNGGTVAEIPELRLADASLGSARIMLTAMYRLTPRSEDARRVWARTSTLAAMIGSDDRTAQRQLKKLEQHGCIREIDGEWELVDPGDEGDNVVAKNDNIVGTRRQYCRKKRQHCRQPPTILSPPTLEEPVKDPILTGESISPPPEAQLELVSPEPDRGDAVARLWSLQDERRSWAFAQHGRTGRRAPRPLKLDASARSSVAKILREYSEAEAATAIENAAIDAADSERSLRYFDGVSNWRPENFRRHANADADLLSKTKRNTLRQGSGDPTKGPMIVQCSNAEDEQACRRPESSDDFELDGVFG